ncbi:bacteriocin fulvocin C-related protein [Draconibacterium sp. IB214405]|uniref:bacteriocin fulvocin C-related protein n=1 Tax=Draconibacterium sp. IB214405 TaxID=3097352 RepID=UPI002A136D29|nr:bacteriocin fulvocin C-related protein [Draconibacterium sp. IB214405]MDX8341778.1 bacteriocin fulvocin C-related protein [Draconibacterium sp. IB214405]
MRRKVLMIIGLLTLLFACDEEQYQYSCDEEVDVFVKENLELFETCNLELLASYSTEIQRAALRMNTPERRFELWNEKYETLLLDPSFSEKEQIHIESFMNQLTVKHFDPENSELFDELLDFYVKWEGYALDTLEWDKETLSLIVASLQTERNLGMNTKSVSTDPMAGSECSCNTGSDFCNDTQASCVESQNCRTGQIMGCGILGMEECDGSCIYGQ